MIFLLSVLISFVSSQYNPDYGYDLFQYARLTYCNSSQINTWFCDPCIYHAGLDDVQVFFNSSHNASALVGYNLQFDEIVIAFRGTVDKKNWFSDFNYFQQPYADCGNCQIHRGFFNVYEDLADEILQFAQIMAEKYPTAKFIITGHSLGAAVSTFAALDIHHRIRPVKSLYNFGSPRVGNAHFADYVEQQIQEIYRVTHDRDSVVHTPSMAQNFKHFGKEIFYNADWTHYIECPSESNLCSNQYATYQLNKNDHLYYYTLCAGCSSSACSKY